jgi:hypothetical protein
LWSPLVGGRQLVAGTLLMMVTLPQRKRKVDKRCGLFYKAPVSISLPGWSPLKDPGSPWWGYDPKSGRGGI